MTITNNMQDKNLSYILKQNNNDLAVYVHFPWCVSKCPYCDFNSHSIKNDTDFAAYTKAVITDLQDNLVTGYQGISSIFLGGGTPSLFQAEYIQKILTALDQTYGFRSDIEITLEANPNSADYHKFKDYHSIGINRLSIGAQSFEHRQLQNLGRAHNPDDIYKAYTAARKAGFDNINLDLMHGLPMQKLPEAIADLTQAIELAPEHISWYQLTIEPNTLFAHAPPKLADADLRSEIQDAGIDLLTSNNFHRIEISAFAKKDYAARHNLHVWNFGDYLGIGAGAHSKYNIAGLPQRIYRHYHPKQYISNTKKIAEQKPIKPQELLFEYMLNRARILYPIDKGHITKVTKMPIENIREAFAEAINQGTIIEHEFSWQLTELGINHLDTVVSQCLKD